jgi:hypothetical protein
MAELDLDRVLLIVAGVHLRAEVGDRPLAYAMVERLKNWLHQQTHDTDWPIAPVVCTDVWYMNNSELHSRPVISIGGPGVNALSAYLYERLPTALAVEDKLVVQVDVEMTDLRAAVWGVDGQHTAAAIDLFARKYLNDFMRAALTQVEPHDEDG